MRWDFDWESWPMRVMPTDNILWVRLVAPKHCFRLYFKVSLCVFFLTGAKWTCILCYVGINNMFKVVICLNNSTWCLWVVFKSVIHRERQAYSTKTYISSQLSLISEECDLSLCWTVIGFQSLSKIWSKRKIALVSTACLNVGRYVVKKVLAQRNTHAYIPFPVPYHFHRRHNINDESCFTEAAWIDLSAAH